MKQLTTPPNKTTAESFASEVFPLIPLKAVKVKPSTFIGARRAQHQKVGLKSIQIIFDLLPGGRLRQITSSGDII
jgi:hypothetical protein